MIITFVRHGEVIDEYRGRYNGHINIPISKKAKEEAKKLSKKLQTIHFDKIYCSDLLRARETLNEFDLDVETIFTPRLREKSWGKDEGKSFEELESEGLKYINFEQWISSLDGEDMQIYKNNLYLYFTQIILKEKCKSILIVTHSGVIKTLIGIMRNLTLEESFSLNVPNLSLTEVDSEDFNLNNN